MRLPAPGAVTVRDTGTGTTSDTGTDADTDTDTAAGTVAGTEPFTEPATGTGPSRNLSSRPSEWRDPPGPWRVFGGPVRGLRSGDPSTSRGCAPLRSG